MHARRHVDERTAPPHGGIQRGELVVAGRDHRAEVLLEELRVFLQRGVGVEEHNPLCLKVFPDLVVNNFALVLGRYTGDQPLLLGLRDAELVVGVLDVLRQVIPRCCLLLRRPHEVLDVVEVDALEVGAPVRHRLLVEDAQRLEPDVEHPLGLALLRRDVTHHRLGQPALRAGARDVRIGPAIAVSTQRLDGLFLGQGFGRGRHVDAPCLVVEASARAVRRSAGCWSWLSGTCVVHAQSPLTIVANRCTWVPSTSAKASRSVSHSSGNSSATCDTGQWCWQSCTPWIGPAHRSGGGGVTGLRQRVGDPIDSRFNVVGPLGYSRQNGVDTATREGANGVVTADLAELAHRRDRQIVVGVALLGPSRGGQPITPGRSAATAVLPCGRRTRLRIAGLEQSVEVPAHTRGGDAQLLADLACRDRSGLQQELDNRPTRVAVDFRTDFHNTIVTEFRKPCKARAP